MSHIELRCTRCRATHAADMAALTCRDCGAPLEVEYLGETPEGATAEGAAWADLDIPLPTHDPGSAVSLGEGDTPCFVLPALGRLLGLQGLYGKLEYLSPSGSFKDRGSAVMMAVAREHGVREVVEDSSGNAGASVSAYAARAGIRAHIFAPASAPRAKLQQIKAYGAEVHPIEGPRDAATSAAMAYCAERSLVYASHALSPYFLEGTKTFAYELAQQSPEGLPGHIVFPVGNGSLLIGAWKGLMELRREGRIAEMPRLHCVQARAVMPLVAAYGGEEWHPDSTGGTVAGGIAVGSPARREQVLHILRATGGAAVAVDDEDILRWQKLMAQKEGLYAEPTSAAAFAGLEQLLGQGAIAAGDLVLVPVTGSGLKDDTPT